MGKVTVQEQDLKQQILNPIYFDGELVEAISDPNPGTRRTDLTEDLQGVKNPISSTETTGGSLSFAAKTDKGVELLERIYSGRNPALTTAFEADPDDHWDPVIYQNIVAADESGWIGAYWFGRHTAPATADVAGGMRAGVAGSFSGDTDRHVHLQGAHIYTRHVQLTLNGANYEGDTSVAAPALIESLDDYYAQYVEPTSGPTSRPVRASLNNSGQYVSSGGLVSIPVVDCAGIGFTPTGAMVYLRSTVKTSKAPAGETWETIWDSPS